jgi:MYXO-CTERM domain-containing protein
MRHSLTAAVAAIAIGSGALAGIITQWTFEGDTANASTGSGTASLIGGTSSTFATGNAGGRAWNTSTYKAQGVGSGEAGVQFLVSTASTGGGFGGISVSFDHRASGTNSRWAQVDYTLDGGASWVTGFWNNNGGLSPHDTFYSFTVDFSSVSGANNNAGFGFRIVSIFSPLAFDQSSTLNPYGANTAYMRANAAAVYSPNTSTATGDYGTSGTWRFDNVTVNGTAIPAPGAVALVGLAGLVTTRRRK